MIVPSTTPRATILLRVANDSAWYQQIIGAIAPLSFYQQWEDQSGAQEARNMIIEAIENAMIVSTAGQINAFVGDLPEHYLLCDGSTYTKAEYPELWEAMPASLKSVTHFTVPNLQNRFLMGDNPKPANQTGGSETHTLSIDEMPIHTHASTPHAHSEIASTLTIINGGLEAPAQASVPTPSTTGLATVDILNSGGGLAHNNLPPYYVVTWGISFI